MSNPAWIILAGISTRAMNSVPRTRTDLAIAVGCKLLNDTAMYTRVVLVLAEFNLSWFNLILSL